MIARIKYLMKYAKTHSHDNPILRIFLPGNLFAGIFIEQIQSDQFDFYTLSMNTKDSQAFNKLLILQ